MKEQKELNKDLVNYISKEETYAQLPEYDLKKILLSDDYYFTDIQGIDYKVHYNSEDEKHINIDMLIAIDGESGYEYNNYSHEITVFKKENKIAITTWELYHYLDSVDFDSYVVDYFKGPLCA